MVVRAHNQTEGRDYTKLGMLECGQQSVVITISSVLIYRSLVVMSTLDAFIEEESTFFPLPCQRAYSNIDGQGWSINTTVRKSQIPGAGNGRFSNENVPKNTVVMEKYMIPMSEVKSLYDVGDDAVILFKNENEIEDFIHLYQEEGNQTREDTMHCLAHFIWSLEELKDTVALNFSTWSVNHGDPKRGENIRFYVHKRKILAKTVKDVSAGDELLNDYRYFDNMDDFWIQFCKKEGKKDVITNLRQFVDIS
ncbi:hypothetical protein CTEN210_05816 [Chaetoceros tenuissimus]|uniref:SET domain-containing protein n=1 Tax=Chaetoceros tenuissimus TaxID=426638 RepID=A0AAD3H3T8_9STRA|nr:hypothetical protein CTEN210_05816 [Chaetoceros tenuissimus]